MSDAVPPPPGPLVDVTLSQEMLRLRAVEWRPYARRRIRKVVRTEEITQKVTVRREELVIDDEPISAVERLEAAFGTAHPPEFEDIEMVLHQEEVVVTTRVVPHERVRIHLDQVLEDFPVEATLRREVIDIDREPIR